MKSHDTKHEVCTQVVYSSMIGAVGDFESYTLDERSTPPTTNCTNHTNCQLIQHEGITFIWETEYSYNTCDKIVECFVLLCTPYVTNLNKVCM